MQRSIKNSNAPPKSKQLFDDSMDENKPYYSPADEEEEESKNMFHNDGGIDVMDIKDTAIGNLPIEWNQFFNLNQQYFYYEL